MKKLALVFTAMLALFAATAIACGGDDDDGGDAAVQPTSAPSASDAVQEITIRGFEEGEAYLFDPKTPSLTPGKVRLTLVNDGPERPHSIDIKTLDGNGDLAVIDRVEVGQRATVEFTISQAGSYNFVCSLRGHADRGMVGVLTVTGGGSGG